MKCDRCGLESEVREAFTTRKQWWGLVTKTYCPSCWEKQYLREQFSSIVWIVAGLVLFDAITFQQGWVKIVSDVLIFGLMSIPLIGGHELAHVAAGRLLGIRVFGVTIGYGRVLFAGRRFGISWEYRLWPLGGGTVMAGPPQKGGRWRLAGAVLAGPSLHGLILLAAFALEIFLLILQGWFNVNAVILIHLTVLFFACNLIHLFSNLLPLKAATPSGQTGTDGWQLLHLAFLKPEDQEIQDQSYYVMESLDALRRNEPDAVLDWVERGLIRYPQQPALRNTLGAAWIEKKKYSEAREVFLSLLSSDEAKRPLFKYLLYNNIAYADLLLQNPDLLPEAEKYSAEAYRQIRWFPEIIGTRGLALLEQGRWEEGIQLLREALGKSKNPRSRAANACHLAVAETRSGRKEEGRRYFDLARKIDPKCYLLEQTAKAVAVE
jgi:tetratricopeptide (TPR) repeat protein